MNKTELIAAVAEKAKLTNKDAEAALKAFTDVVAEELKKDEKIQLVGFGTFEAAKVPEKTGTIQFGEKKGQAYKKPACKNPKFKPGKALKDAIN